MFPAKSSYTRGSQPESSSSLADFSDGLEFLLARVPPAWKCLYPPQISSPMPSRTQSIFGMEKGKWFPVEIQKPQKNSTGATGSRHMDQVSEQLHLLAPHTWTLCRAGQPSQKDMTQTHTHTHVQKEGISGRTHMRASIPLQPNEGRERKDLICVSHPFRVGFSFSLQEGARWLDCLQLWGAETPNKRVFAERKSPRRPHSVYPFYNAQKQTKQSNMLFGCTFICDKTTHTHTCTQIINIEFRAVFWDGQGSNNSW